MRHAVILGARGQLGSDLHHALGAGAWRVSALARPELDVCDSARVEQALRTAQPDVVINCTACNAVEQCEDDPAPAFAVNAVAVHQLARLANALDCTLVHFSTNYVFDGGARTPYTEEAPPFPLNVYGISKVAGEHLVRRYCRRHFVIRTTGLYGHAGAHTARGNFVETMLRRGSGGAPVRVVDDQILTPTATADLARAVVGLLESRDGAPVGYGLYHLTNAGECSWFEFARMIFALRGMPVDLAPVSSAAAGTKARRPAYSVLDCGRWTRAGLPPLRPWQDALRDYLGARPR
jgi:dTDP-4-dehydrorhamnose reductase